MSKPGTAASSDDEAAAWYGKGLEARGRGDHAQALGAFNQALRLKPDYAEACFALATLLDETASLLLSLKTYEHLLKIAPQHAEGKTRFKHLSALLPAINDWCAKGLKAAESGDMDAAAQAYRHALDLHPGLPEAWANLALVYYRLRRFADSQSAAEQALRLKPDYAEAYNTLGGVAKDTGMYGQAVVFYRKAVALNPAYLNGWYNLGYVLQKEGDNEGAINAFREAVKLDPDHAMALTELIHRLHYACAWEGLADLEAKLIALLGQSEQSASPFIVALYTPPVIQLTNAKRWAKKQFPLGLPYNAAAKLPASAREGGKLRIGYLSSDYCHHATAFLVGELFENHDRSRFEVYAYSSGIDDASVERARIMKAVDVFRDIRLLDTRASAQRVRGDGIDILIDMKGYTENNRMELMAQRPAPLQLHYLGYPGTTGAEFIDYFLADPVTAPHEMDAYFSEKLIRLPHSYQINDRKRALPQMLQPRAAYGLPETGFVFCGFNLCYKITPEIFNVWIRLLKAVEGSVLWLYEPNALTVANLRHEAAARGVEPARLVFAAFVPQNEHLHRYVHADLFLDTSPVCGHTTASDALWCGVPVVTVKGNSFAGCVAASLLAAVGLPELATANLGAYEALAFSLACEETKRRQIRTHLEKGRMAFPLFDSKATTRALEAAYQHMAALHRGGQAPQSFSITDAGALG